MRRQPLAVVVLSLAIFVMVGGVMLVLDVGPDWYQNIVTVASFAMLVPLVLVLRQRTDLDRRRRVEQGSAQ